MKSIIVLIVLVLALASCATEPAASYSDCEMKTFVSTGQAVFQPDSLTVRINYVDYKFPIVKMGTFGYYPGMSLDAELRYYLAKK